jgi:hypothetical protein
LGACTLVLSIISALGIGTTRNAFIPAYAILAIVFGLGLQVSQENIATLLPGRFRWIGNILLIAVCLGQFSLMQYKARDYIPSARDFKRANALIKELRNTEGEFFIPSQNYLALFVNKKVYYHDAPLGELTGRYGHSLPQWPVIQEEITALVHSGHVNVVYLENPADNWSDVPCEQETELPSQSKFVPTFYKMICR